MAYLGSGGDCSNVKDEDMHRGGGGWEVMPDGWYRFVCQGSEYKDTRAGNGKCLHLKHICLDSRYRGEEKRDHLTLEHPKAQTVQIARAGLKELALAVGHPSPDFVRDSKDLEGIPFMARLYSEAASDPKYGDKDGLENRIGEYRGVNDPMFSEGGQETSAPAQSGAGPEDEPPPPGDSDDIPF